jgi:hypothetical protein
MTRRSTWSVCPFAPEAPGTCRKGWPKLPFLDDSALSCAGGQHVVRPHVLSLVAVPVRDEIVPLSDPQSCAVCSAQDWSWLYLLLTAQEWVQGLGWFANWFVVLCDECHEAWERGPRG